MAILFPSDWPIRASLPFTFAAIWNLDPLSQLRASESLLQPHERELRRQYQEGPCRNWGVAVGKEITLGFPGLHQCQIADRLGLHPGTLGRLLKGQLKWAPDLLFAIFEQARLYMATLPPDQRVQVGLHQLPPEPNGAAYRRYARISAMAFTLRLLPNSDPIHHRKPNDLRKRRTLACWQYELLDDMLSNHLPDFLQYLRRYGDLAPVLARDKSLQGLVRTCALNASQQPCLPDHDRQRLARLPDELSLGYAVCRELRLVFDDWQESWKATTDYVARWELEPGMT